jgi:ribosomal-protein-alanine N-acetyltransferase
VEQPDGDEPVLWTPRLMLRRWRADDREPYAAINADPEVMAHLGRLTREESDAAIERYEAHFAREGFGKWALQLAGEGGLIGSVGLERVEFPARFTPAVEIGWRLARRYWGQGYATEAARRTLDFAFDDLGLPGVVAYAPPGNRRSFEVMERLGMVHDPDGDFVDTRLSGPAVGTSYRLYRIEHRATGRSDR